MSTETFSRPLHIRWSDIDANFHLRHSAYYDFAAQMRMEVLAAHGLDMGTMAKAGIGPILFREEAIFKREIRHGDSITINVELVKMRRDRSRWSFRHTLVRADGTLCAIMNVDGAWIDMKARKLTVPPSVADSLLDALPRSSDFAWEEVPA